MCVVVVMYQPSLYTSILITSLALGQSYDCPSASEATLIVMGKYITWLTRIWQYNHNDKKKQKKQHNKIVCIFHGIYCGELSQEGMNDQQDLVIPVPLFIKKTPSN